MKPHKHKFKPSERFSWEVCSCGTFHCTVPFDRSGYLGEYWGGSKSTLAEQRHNLEVIENENGESKVRAALKHCVPGSILEIACAPGSFLRIAQEEGFEVEGCEPDEAYAGQISEYAKAPVHIGFFEDIDFERTYTNLVAMDLLEHLSDPETFIRDAFSLVEDGGRLILMLPLIDTCREQDFHPEHMNLWSRAYIEEWLHPVLIEPWLPGHDVVVLQK